jgi:glycosyltransferase involved in cell wall biosynthesis
MVYLILPFGKTFGWGVCGQQIVKELSRLTPVRYLTQGFDRKQASNDLEFRFFAELLAREDEVRFLETANDRFPVLQGIGGRGFQPQQRRVLSPNLVGYTFFESDVPAAWVETARSYYHVIATGSAWCTSILRDRGLTNVVTVVQGVDPLTFNPSLAEKQYFRDRFVVFSGGKFELRKGQDVVIRAYRVLQDRHRDVLLVHAWFNHWAHSARSMAASPHIRLSTKGGGYEEWINQTLADNGIDVGRTVCITPCDNVVMARVYQQTDVGLFPNRCEGGTNLVLMEYMACGKPAIASFSSGHKDVVSPANAVLIRDLRPTRVNVDRDLEGVYDEPNLDEVVAHLEWAYNHRSELRALGQAAGRHLAGLTWRRTAEQFHALLTGGQPAPRG